MNYRTSKKFEKQVIQLTDKNILIEVDKALEDISQATIIGDISNIKKMAGFKNAYRIKIKDYRIGLYLIDDEK